MEELLYWVSLHLKTFDILLDEGVYCKIIFWMYAVRLATLYAIEIVVSLEPILNRAKCRYQKL